MFVRKISLVQREKDKDIMKCPQNRHTLFSHKREKHQDLTTRLLRQIRRYLFRG